MVFPGPEKPRAKSPYVSRFAKRRVLLHTLSRIYCGRIKDLHRIFGDEALNIRILICFLSLFLING